MPLAHPQTDSEFSTILLNAGTTPVIVDFFATWCGPCNAIAPFFKEVSDKYPNLRFAKVDVDKCQDTAQKNGVSAMPTFVTFLNGQKMDQIRGADKGILENFVAKWSKNCPSQLESPVAGQMDLLGFIQQNQCECLNESDRFPFSAFIAGQNPKLVSDVDEQLIINIQFNAPVKIHSLKIRGPGPNAPKSVKLFINNPIILDFDKAQSSKPVQSFDFSVEPLQSVYYVKFQNVQSLLIFVDNNKGDEEQTIIEELKIYGTPLQATNMSDFKRVAGKAGEASH